LNARSIGLRNTPAVEAKQAAGNAGQQQPQSVTKAQPSATGTAPTPAPKPPAVTLQPPQPQAKHELVGRRVSVFWKLDKAWYEGEVKAYDAQKQVHQGVRQGGCMMS
jgi:DNA mismatch repair protein MSH6